MMEDDELTTAQMLQEVSNSEFELECSKTSANGARIDSEEDEIWHSRIGLKLKEVIELSGESGYMQVTWI